MGIDICAECNLLDVEINPISYIYNANVNNVIQVPNTYAEAINSNERSHWLEAMDSEMQSLYANETFDLVPLPKGHKAIGGRWVYSLKTDPTGQYTYKARFVAKGYSQFPGVSFDETYAPTAKTTTLRMLLNISVQFDLIINQYDVKNAYLNSSVDKEIYMKQPEGFETGQNVVCRLNKAI